MELRTEYAVSEIGRTLIGRLLPGTDLVPGILSMCSESGIRFGYIASLVGTLAHVRFVHVNRSPGSPSGFGYTRPVEKTGPLEILSAQGTLGEGEDGEPCLNLHALLCDERNRVLGGQILEAGCPVLATVEVVIRETRGIRLVRGPDEEAGVSLFKVSSGF